MGRKLPQRLCSENGDSSWQPVSGDVPQGSVLDPRLFNSFVSNVGDMVQQVR